MNSFAADKLKQAFDLITEVDKAKVRKAVQDARNKNSNLSNEELAIQFFDESRLKAAGVGFGLGISGNPLRLSLLLLLILRSQQKQRFLLQHVLPKYFKKVS